VATGRFEQRLFGDDLDLYLANDAVSTVRALAKEYGMSKSRKRRRDREGPEAPGR
jgi:hypothetical protein